MVVRIVIALACITLTLHWMEKSSCSDGNWGTGKQLTEYRHACYTDVVALYNSEGSPNGEVPYLDHAVEYPVLTGAFMGLIGLPVHAYAADHPSTNPYDAVLQPQRADPGGARGRVGRGHPVAAAPPTVGRRDVRGRRRRCSSPRPSTGTCSRSAFAMFALLAWARRTPALAAVMIGLGAAAKLWPAFLLIPILLLGWRARRLGDAIYTTAIAG